MLLIAEAAAAAPAEAAATASTAAASFALLLATLLQVFFEIVTWCQSYKTFYGRKLRIFGIS
jgi:ABC-type uncharacterized transport system permease subunit